MNTYIQIARPDNWFKNIFMLPGIVFALLFASTVPPHLFVNVVLGFISTSLIASANYVINEWLDRHKDKFHPEKKHRSLVNHHVSLWKILLEYFLLAAVGLAIAKSLSIHFLVYAVIFLCLGILYNVPPLRLKERTYIDVLCESLNNPIRFLLGWSIIEVATQPPSSILLAYWMGGAFLMAMKRFAEYRYIGDPVKAAMYRSSFRNYDENTLLITAFFYALCCSFFLGVFLIKYRIEYLILFPFLSILFAWYLKLALDSRASVWKLEKIYQEKSFLAYLIFLSVLFLVLSFVNIPSLNIFMERVSFG